MLNWSKSPSIQIASEVMHQGGVIAYPTEAVWGLGCDPFNEEAVFALLSLKHRSPKKGLILIASHIRQFDFILNNCSKAQIGALKETWPGPYTWIVPTNKHVPKWISGNHDGVALRVTNHPVVKALCDSYGGPIVSTSANPEGKTEARHQWQVYRFFKDKPQLAYITKGIVGRQSRPSQIRDLVSNTIIRE